MPLLRSYGRRAAPDSSVRSGMFIATRAARSAKLRRSGMFIGTGTNNGLRQAPSGAAWNHSSAPQSDMPLLTELGSRGVRLSYKHAAPTELWATGRPRLGGGHLSYKHAAPTELWATGRPRLGGCASAINMPLFLGFLACPVLSQKDVAKDRTPMGVVWVPPIRVGDDNHSFRRAAVLRSSARSSAV